MVNLIAAIEFHFLKTFYKIDPNVASSVNRLPLENIFTHEFQEKVSGKFVVDFGCGHGADTEIMAVWGAKLALGLEIRDELVQLNLKRVKLDNCLFATTLPEKYFLKADLVISIDAFEHFTNPSEMLQLMFNCLHVDGEAYISFGPTWYHPYGGHIFSVFPWAHLIFSEKALMRWRNQYFQDGANHFHEVAGGLNKLSISSFEKIFKNSGFIVEKIDCKPIRKWKWLPKILGRELSTSMVLVILKKP